MTFRTREDINARQFSKTSESKGGYGWAIESRSGWMASGGRCARQLHFLTSMAFIFVSLGDVYARRRRPL